MSYGRAWKSLLLALAAVIAFAPGGIAGQLEIDVERAAELAVANNPRMKVAESDVAIAGESRKQAYRTQAVSVAATHSSSYADYQKDDIHQNTFSNGITMSYPLYSGGGIENTMKKSDLGYQEQEKALEKVRQDLRMSVATGFYSMQQKSDMAKLADESVERLKAHVENVRIQYENGKVGKADLLRSEVELSNGELSRVSALNAYAVAVKQLNSLMGVPLETELTWSKGMSHEKFPHTLEACEAFAQKNHPDFLMAELRVREAEIDVDIARGDKRPKANLSATQNLSSNIDSEWPGFREDNFSIQLVIEYTLLDSGVSSSKIASAKEAVQRAKHDYEATRDSIFLSVNSDFMGIMEAERRIELSKDALEDAREAYAIALNRYEEGVGT
ncbi:MAG: TolC family protein, partial [Synergistaceae bacterium]|nr:TolC family protein [Synergistaceae bacterium]